MSKSNGKLIFFFVLCIFIAISCKNSSDCEYFNGEIVYFEDTLHFENLIGEAVILDGLYTGRMDVYDSLLFMQYFNYPDYFIAVFNHYTGEHLGDFMPKGRAPDEYVDLSWIYQFYWQDGHLKGLLDCFSRKEIVIWDITESLNSGLTSTRNVKFQENNPRNILGGYMFLHNNEYIVANIKAPGSQDLPDQTFHKIDYTTHETIDTFSFYKSPIENIDEILKILYHHIPFTHNLKGTKLSLGMAILHQINILDIETGQIKGYRKKNTPNFRNSSKLQQEKKCHYISLTADNDYIYALYVGEEIDLSSGFPNGRIIHVFDWNGIFVRKLYLDKEAGHICLDPNKNMLLIKNDYTDEIFRYNLNIKN